VRNGRLVIGPNYMLPDEFLIGGEAHIRNLMTGIRSARAYGGVMMVGYAPDAFGHIMHLPAILRGFGIDSVLIWRGVGDDVKKSEFRWRAPDGSEVLVLHFPHGYGGLETLPADRQRCSKPCSGCGSAWSRTQRRSTRWRRTAATTWRRTTAYRSSSRRPTGRWTGTRWSTASTRCTWSA